MSLTEEASSDKPVNSTLGCCHVPEIEWNYNRKSLFKETKSEGLQELFKMLLLE